MKAMALVWTAAAILSVTPATAQEGDMPGSCQGFLQANQILRQQHDPIALLGYREVAERVFDAVNKMVVSRGGKPLSLSSTPDERAKRLQMVETTCSGAATQTFRDAVIKAYFTMRQAAGLPGGMPN
jgi:hypothetical protein